MLQIKRNTFEKHFGKSERRDITVTLPELMFQRCGKIAARQHRICACVRGNKMLEKRHLCNLILPGRHLKREKYIYIYS